MISNGTSCEKRQQIRLRFTYRTKIFRDISRASLRFYIVYSVKINFLRIIRDAHPTGGTPAGRERNFLPLHLATFLLRSKKTNERAYFCSGPRNGFSPIRSRNDLTRGGDCNNFLLIGRHKLSTVGSAAAGRVRG